MRDQGLARAIAAIGGMRSLARAIGVSQPAISNWKRVPADRVIAIETVTGVSRKSLRPDLYQAKMTALDDVDQARSIAYALIGRLLWRAPDHDILSQVSRLNGEATPFGTALSNLADAARRSDAGSVAQSFFRIFIGVGRGEILPYASYYLTGFLNDRPLAKVRADLVAIGVSRSERAFEPEDHIAILFDVMSGLISGAYPDRPIDQELFFARHLAPWAARFFADLESLPDAGLYAAVGTVGRTLIEIETQAFSMPQDTNVA